MIRKSIGFILLITMTCAVVFAQNNSEPNKEKKKMLSKAYGLALTGGSYLGIQTREITKENFAKSGLNEVKGVAVEKVIENSPAAKSGLQDGDVIVNFNGEAVTSTRKLTRLISEVAADHTVNITILRKGLEQKLNVTMGQRPQSRIFDSSFEFPEVEVPEIFKNSDNFPKSDGETPLVWNFSANRSIGVGVINLTEQLGDYFGVNGEKGLLINNVSKDSPAERAGLKAGDVIVEVDGKEVKNSFDLIRKINEKKEGEVNLTIIRNKNRQTISVTPDKRKGGVVNFSELGKIESALKEGIEVSPRMKTFVIPDSLRIQRMNTNPVIITDGLIPGRIL